MKKYDTYKFLFAISFIMLTISIMSICYDIIPFEDISYNILGTSIGILLIGFIALIVESKQNKMTIKSYIEKIKNDTIEEKKNEAISKMICKKCKSDNVNVQIISEKKSRGCLSILFWIILAFCTFGIVLLIPLLKGTGSKQKKIYVCQNCGHNWQ